MKRYKVGDTVWVAWTGVKDVKEPCQVCFGKLTVDLTLGNGDTVTLPCGFCSVGYNPPCGYRLERHSHAGAEQKIIDAIETKTTEEGKDVVYRSGHHILASDRVFDSRDEAVAKCHEIAEELNRQEQTRLDCIKADVKKSFSWNAGYHMREAKRHERDAAHHREKAVLCKARKGDDET